MPGPAHLCSHLPGGWTGGGGGNSSNLARDMIITHKVKERVVDSNTSHTAVMGVGLDVLTSALCKSLRSSSQLWKKLAEWEAFSWCLLMA